MNQYQKNVTAYVARAREKFVIDLAKGERDLWKQYAASKGKPLATFIKEYMRESMERDNFKPNENSDNVSSEN